MLKSFSEKSSDILDVYSMFYIVITSLFDPSNVFSSTLAWLREG